MEKKIEKSAVRSSDFLPFGVNSIRFDHWLSLSTYAVYVQADGSMCE